MSHLSLVSPQRAATDHIHARRVTLRPLQNDDFASWLEVRQRNEEWLTPWGSARHLDHTDPATDRLSFLLRCSAGDRRRENKLGYPLGLFIGDRFAGEVNVDSVVRHAQQSGTISYWIDRAHAGNAYVPEAVVALTRFAFEQLHLHRLEIPVVQRNTNSRRVMEKLDYRCEGLAERFLEVAGVWEDHLRYAITVEEWATRRDELAAVWL
jgi:[ribosomal protein S5]-alanine N-acetyltransferase